MEMSVRLPLQVGGARCWALSSEGAGGPGAAHPPTSQSCPPALALRTSSQHGTPQSPGCARDGPGLTVLRNRGGRQNLEFSFQESCQKSGLCGDISELWIFSTEKLFQKENTTHVQALSGPYSTP